MNKSQALKEAVRRWGDQAVVIDDGKRNASTPEERKAASDQRRHLLATLTSEEKKARRKELDALLSAALRNRYRVGVHGGFFIGIRGYGDSWEEAFAVADRMWSSTANQLPLRVAPNRGTDG